MRSYAAIPLFVALASSQIDPSTISISIRNQWCVSQKAACPALCADQTGRTSTSSNTCEPKNLGFSCVCANGISPNATEYSQTIPYFLCTEANNQCVTGCGASSSCAAACRDDNPCGARDPTRQNTSTLVPTSTSAGASATGSDAVATEVGTFGGAGADSGSSSGAQETGTVSQESAAMKIAMGFGQSFGIAAVAAGIFAGFGLVL